MAEIREDMTKLQIALENLKDKIDTIKINTEKPTRLRTNNQRIGRLIWNEDRTLRPERIKNY